MADYVFLVGPWAKAGRHWRLPPGCRGGLDFRTRAQVLGGGGAGVFMLPKGAAVPEGYATLRASGDAREAKPDSRDRGALRSILGLAAPLEGVSLADLLWEALTTHACPRGEAFARPLVPSDGLLALHLPGHGKVKAEAFTWGRHPHTNKLRDQLRQTFAKVRASHPEDTARRHLGALVGKYPGLDSRDICPDLPPLHPHTTITESFDQADSTTIGPDLTWTNTADPTAWETFGSRVRLSADELNGATSPVWESLKATTALSSDDQNVTLNLAAYLTDNSIAIAIGPTARHASGPDFYAHVAVDNLGGQEYRLVKSVAGVATDLDVLGANVVLGWDVLLRVTGSTIFGTDSGADDHSTTDTDITGNLNAGIAGFGRDAGVAEVRGKFFIAEDGNGTATVRPQGAWASAPLGVVSAGQSASGRPSGASASGGRTSAWTTGTVSDSATVRPNGASAFGAPGLVVLSVTDASVTARPSGVMAFGSPGLSANDSVATVRPVGALASAPRLSIAVDVNAAVLPRGASAAGPRVGIVNSPAVAARPQGAWASSPATATIVLSPTITVQPPGLYAAGHAQSVTADGAASVRPQSGIASAPTFAVQLVHAVSVYPRSAFASAPSFTVTLTTSVTQRPQGMNAAGGRTGAVAGGASASTLPQGALAAAPLLTAASSPQVIHAGGRGVTAAAGRTATLTADAAITVRPQAMLATSHPLTIPAASTGSLSPGWLWASTVFNRATVIDADHLPVTVEVRIGGRPSGASAGARRAGVAVGPDVPTITGVNGLLASGPAITVSGGHSVGIRPQGAFATGGRAAAGANATPTVSPAGLFAAGPQLTITVPASVAVRASGAFASAPLLGPMLASAAGIVAPGMVLAGGPQARAFARTGTLYWIPVDGGHLDDVDALTGHIDQEPPP